MKKMRKTGLFYILFFMLLFVFFADSPAFANDSFSADAFILGEQRDDALPDSELPLPLENFEVTSGLAKKTESTFDPVRTIAGTAEKDTFITIRTYRYGEDEEEIEMHFYEITVGASGMFAQVIDLSLGENQIEITAVLDDRETVKKVVIKRKNEEIKRELEQGANLIDLL